jgi:hypothetical protein
MKSGEKGVGRFGHDAPRRSTASAINGSMSSFAINHFTKQVGVTAVTGVLLDHVHDDETKIDGIVAGLVHAQGIEIYLAGQNV